MSVYVFTLIIFVDAIRTVYINNILTEGFMVTIFYYYDEETGFAGK